MKNFIIKKLAYWFRRYAQRKNNVTVERILFVADEIMRSQKYCFLNTFERGEVYSRVLQAFPPNDDFVVHFGTSPLSRKVKQIEKNPRGSISYLDTKKGAAVSLVGQFEISTEIELRRKYFFQAWWAFFTAGPEGDDFVVLSFKPDRIEVWDASRGLTPEPFGLKSAIAIKTGVSSWELTAKD